MSTLEYFGLLWPTWSPVHVNPEQLYVYEVTAQVFKSSKTNEKSKDRKFQN